MPSEWVTVLGSAETLTTTQVSTGARLAKGARLDKLPRRYPRAPDFLEGAATTSSLPSTMGLGCRLARSTPRSIISKTHEVHLEAGQCQRRYAACGCLRDPEPVRELFVWGGSLKALSRMRRAGLGLPGTNVQAARWRWGSLHLCQPPHGYRRDIYGSSTAPLAVERMSGPGTGDWLVEPLGKIAERSGILRDVMDAVQPFSLFQRRYLRHAYDVQETKCSPIRTSLSSSTSLSDCEMGLRDISAMGPVPFPQDGHTGPDFPVLLIGAGVAMFGTSEGPWNIALRLENRLGPRLKVQAVIDVSEERAEAALKLKCESLVKGSYEHALALPTVAEFKKYVDAGKAVAPKAVFVATPPRWRGSLQKGYDLKLQILDAFPHVHLFIEKPPATGVPWDQSVSDAKKIGELLNDKTRYKGVHSMGYVLRYNRGAREIKKILQERNLTVCMATVARYFGAYELATKTDWWDTSISLGPILEQGTHLCDLSRFFGGDIDPDTMHAHVLEAWEKPTSTLSKLSFDEEEIEVQNRVPRCTSATWKYTSGAVGTAVHGTVLHGVDYSIEIEVYADGHQLILQDPFGVPSISIREPGCDVPRVIPMTGDDPYQTEMDAFIDCIESEGMDNRIMSTFEDAAKSYEMTWAMRNSAEQSGKEQRKKKGRTDVPSWSSEWKQ